MIDNKRYRFSIVNSCDAGEEFDVTNIDGDTGGYIFEIGVHDIEAGDYVLLEGNDPKINGIQLVESVTGDSIFILMDIDVDNLIHGTVQKLNHRFVDPLNFYNTKFIWEKDSDEIFFRRKLSGKLKFNNPDSQNNDWSYFENYILSNPCCKVKFIIEKKCSGDWVIDWEGYITHNMGKWNLSHCNVETDVEVDDDYTCILDSKGNDVNVLEGTETHTVSISVETQREEFECCKDVTEPILMGLRSCDCLPCNFEYDQSNGNTLLQFVGVSPTLFSAECADEIPDGPAAGWAPKKLVITDVTCSTGCVEDTTVKCLKGTFCMTFIREVLVTFDVDGEPQQPSANGGNEWGNAESLIIAGFNATKWVRNPSTIWDENVFTTTCVDGGTCPSQITFDYSDAYPLPNPTEYNTGRLFSDVCNKIVTSHCGVIQGIRSDFFEIDPPGDTYGYVPGTNYVTGLDNKLANMMFIQLSDFIDPDADQPAFIGNMTFEQLAELWRKAFNAYWFVDADGYVRVEHISWFQRIAAIDTTTTVNGNHIRNKGLKVFTFDRQEIPIREEFKWQLQGGVDFIGYPIKYDSPCVNPKNTKRHDLTFVSTDTTFISFFSDPEDKIGFVLICLDPDDTSVIDREVALVTGFELNNAHLSWANLHYAYHRHDRWLSEGNMNNTDETFLSSKKTKRQVPIKYLGDCCDEIDPLTDLVTTELGNGQIDKMSKDNRDELYTFELLF